ncbi:hypothetical protein GLAREA_12274 [Glarea lozoyensis ATCC 20868]|uniref:Uncharacterized protein n=1 Tax=Glarea lozoyensis (strain ATCC 20868 / MF5171) TaxID=1116229 RepID=S3DYT7_GLAL2|nr:uncharacterized protein GLAREA_12274 [Glarea lozoyensis ATCC 20868]EPE31518.1 hypothetical protein GLAREA_12274 [Glarea lozoyensis ATCC 20868]
MLKRRFPALENLVDPCSTQRQQLIWAFGYVIAVYLAVLAIFPLSHKDQHSNSIMILVKAPVLTVECLNAYHLVVSWTCKRWPNIAGILLIQLKAKDSKGFLVEQDGKSAVSAVRIVIPTVDTVACMSLFLFVLNLVICVLWYSWEYDATGTVNPAWTNVFG